MIDVGIKMPYLEEMIKMHRKVVKSSVQNLFMEAAGSAKEETINEGDKMHMNLVAKRIVSFDVSFKVIMIMLHAHIKLKSILNGRI